MKVALSLLLLLLVSSDAYAQTARIDRIDIVEYGIYTADLTRLTQSARDSNGILRNTLSNNMRHATTTTTVPAELGTRFGFRYLVIGNPAGTIVTLRKVTKYPAPGLRPPGVVQVLTESVTMPRAAIGKAGYTGYAFDDPFELMPGTWTMELWDGDRKLVSQSFNIVK